MNTNLVILPLACLMTAGCVSKLSVQSMIETNNAEVINPRFDALDGRVDEMAGQLGESKRLTDQQRRVLIRHFELLGELSTNALSELQDDNL